jgi:hypothetical protein
MATLNTQWPSPTFPESTKTLLANFFALVESKDPDSGERIAHEIFTPDGVTKSGAMVYKGTERPSSHLLLSPVSHLPPSLIHVSPIQ